MVYIIKSSRVAGGSHAEINFLKENFGDNWREGMRKNPHLDRPNPSAVQQAKERMAKESRQAMVESAKNTMTEMRKCGKINGEQASKIDRGLRSLGY